MMRRTIIVFLITLAIFVGLQGVYGQFAKPWAEQPFRKLISEYVNMFVDSLIVDSTKTYSILIRSSSRHCWQRQVCGQDNRSLLGEDLIELLIEARSRQWALHGYEKGVYVSEWTVNLHQDLQSYNHPVVSFAHRKFFKPGQRVTMSEAKELHKVYIYLAHSPEEELRILIENSDECRFSSDDEDHKYDLQQRVYLLDSNGRIVYDFLSNYFRKTILHKTILLLGMPLLPLGNIDQRM